MNDKNNLINFNPPQEQKEEKDFHFPLSLDDFKIEENKKKIVGSLGELNIITYLKTKKSYLLKITKKKEIVSQKIIKSTLDNIYKIQPNPYCIKLLYHFEDDEQFYFIFRNYENIKSILELFSEYEINDNNLCIMYHQILIGVSFLHKQKIYGSLLNINSLIYDENDRVIKLTDCGLSNLFPEKKEDNPYSLNNGALFSEYIPPEFLLEKNFQSQKNKEDNKKGEKYDMWQLGVLFFKLASENQSPFEGNESSQIQEKILKCKVSYYKINDRSSKIFQIIGKLITKNSERYKLNKMLRLEPFTYPFKKIPQLDFIQKEKKIVNLETIRIYPKESFIPKLKKENLFTIQLERQQALDLSSDLNRLNDEYLKLNKSKLALKNLLTYINKQINIYKNEDKEETNDLIKKFEQLYLGNETSQLYNEIFTQKKGISEERYQSLIRLLIYEITNLKTNLDKEKNNNIKSKKIFQDELDSKNEIIKTYEEKIAFLNSKIQILEETIFQEPKNSDKLILNSIENSLQQFSDLIEKLKSQSDNINNTISQRIEKFLNEKELYFKDLIEAKKLFRNEIMYFFKDNDLIEREIPKSNTMFIKSNPNYETQELLNTINKLKEELKQSKIIIDNNTETMEQMIKAIQDKEAIISEFQIRDNNVIDDD